MLFSEFLKKFGLKGVLAIGFAVIAFLLLWASGISPKGIIWSAYWPAIFVLQFIIITTPWRSVPLKICWNFFLIGMSLVPALTLAVQYLLYQLLYSTSLYLFFTSDQVFGSIDLMAPVVAPITEEILKFLPVLVFLLLGRNRAWRRLIGPIDAMLLGAASGAGFEFIENMFRVTNNYWAPLGPDRVASVASPHIGSLYLFPNMVASDMYGVPTVWFGHGEMTACVALAAGLGFFLRKQCRLWWLLPSLTLLWAIWDHFLVNYLGPDPTQWWARVLPALDLYGYLLPYVFLAGLGYSVYLTNKTQRWYVEQDPSAASPLASLLRHPGRLLKLSEFMRLRLMAAYALRDFAQDKPDKAIHRALWVWSLRQQAVEQKAKLEQAGVKRRARCGSTKI